MNNRILPFLTAGLLPLLLYSAAEPMVQAADETTEAVAMPFPAGPADGGNGGGGAEGRGGEAFRFFRLTVTLEP